MKIIDDKRVVVGPSSDFVTDTTGIVLKDSKETGKNTLGLFIPRLMMGMDIKGGKKEDVMSVSYSKIKNSKTPVFGDMVVNWRNYVEVPCLQIPNVQLPKYSVGERVYVTFADQDITSIAFLPYSVTDIKKRKVDVVDFGVSARMMDTDELTDDNTYRWRFDSKNQIVQLFITKANGEVSTYNITVDAKSGKVIIGDEKRFFTINTNDDMIQIENEAGAIWQMKEAKVTVTCEEYLVEAKDKITFKSPAITLDGDDLVVKMTNSIAEESGTKTVKGKELKSNFQTSEYTGMKTQRKFDQDIVNSPVFTISNFLAAAEIGWQCPPGMKALPTSASITDAGSANFAFPKPLGMGLAKAQPTLTILSFLATQIDILYGMFFCPPMASSVVSGTSALVSSTFVKG